MLSLSVSFRVKQFEYNGFFGKVNNDVFMLYTANFIRWTDDPGIALFECSDGFKRLIPTFALEPSGGKVRGCPSPTDLLPRQSYENKVLFGAASQS